MGKIVSDTITDFSKGVVNDPRSTRKGVAQMLTNFDISTDPHRLIPTRDSESGGNGADTLKWQNFCVGYDTVTTTWRLFALGVVSGTARAAVYVKELTTGGANDLDDGGWGSAGLNSESASGSTSFDLFLYYHRVGKIFGAKAGTHIWAFTPDGATAFAETHRALSYTHIAQGLVHTKDDIAYIPYDNKIATNNNGSWTDAALTLPSHLKITNISERGDFLHIACAPVSGVGTSRSFLWDRDSSLTTLSENIDWNEGNLTVLEEVEGLAVGISVVTDATRFKYRVIFRYYDVTSGARKFAEFTSTTAIDLRPAKQLVDGRLYFLMSGTFNGAVRSGLWSITRTSDGFAITHERTQDNDTALGNGVLKNFFKVGDYTFIAYVDNAGANALTKTNDQATFTATALVETLKISLGAPDLVKKLHSIAAMYEPLPSGASVSVKYRTDDDTSWTLIYTDSDDNSLSHTAINIESTGEHFDEAKEYQFRIESTGGAVITGLRYEMEVIGKTPST